MILWPTSPDSGVLEWLAGVLIPERNWGVALTIISKWATSVPTRWLQSLWEPQEALGEKQVGHRKNESILGISLQVLLGLSSPPAMAPPLPGVSYPSSQFTQKPHSYQTGWLFKEPATNPTKETEKGGRSRKAEGPRARKPKSGLGNRRKVFEMRVPWRV